jgi:hypothetical protein
MVEKTPDNTEEDRYETAMAEIMTSTDVVITPEPNSDTTFWLYSMGMNDNWDMPDIEMREVPSSFMSAAGSVINEMNAYRRAQPGNPMKVGQSVTWSTGEFIITESEAHDGMYTWEVDEMIRLSPSVKVHIGCACCAAKDAGIEE